MKYIDEEKINNLLAGCQKPDSGRIESILDKARTLRRLSLEESAALLMADEPAHIRKIFESASFVKEAIYGKRVVLFAPLYISNLCVNDCAYCGFRSTNARVKRRALTMPEITGQIEWLLRRGHKRILAVCGEAAPGGMKNIDYYTQAVEAIYAAKVDKHRIKRVNVNCAPLSVDEFKQLKSSGIGTFQIFQETYHDQTYRKMHIKGPKSDPDNRITAPDRAFASGIDDIGIGPLYGLYDWRFETLGLLSHVEHMEQEFNVGPHTISVPRIEPAEGADVSFDPPYRVSDEDFKKIVAVLRLSVPYTGIIMSTRESPAMRDALIGLGVSQISAESSTSPGGYSENRARNEAVPGQQAGSQFSLGDSRSLDEIIGSLISYGYIPSFCAACYRKERTGEAFMKLAKPGTIKGKCSMNALITLKEYLDDFASLPVRSAGYKLIAGYSEKLDPGEREMLKIFFDHVDAGLRDEYV
ncbi:MAG: [FeFe] hydrogenase H-cluster radical SAM maturase HydG [Candidatus Omnitrophica bacterium]|nr:[FeFe] hydrogenase H-cluster radical SAM maturase HydG [Candidatus Omnitrophota bacterium]MDD5042522.1 [FeFe] hydrogenase H-cluster radical SAM maturase HydG [Candidatus Omnitrophota bacterium]MDD5500717.1 [FeFe] hydrogenase H-cluster radical SAM maturase HydG [Candidatus Omnitrophota bacterium]